MRHPDLIAWCQQQGDTLNGLSDVVPWIPVLVSNVTTRLSLDGVKVLKKLISSQISLRFRSIHLNEIVHE